MFVSASSNDIRTSKQSTFYSIIPIKVCGSSIFCLVALRSNVTSYCDSSRSNLPQVLRQEIRRLVLVKRFRKLDQRKSLLRLKKCFTFELLKLTQLLYIVKPYIINRPTQGAERGRNWRTSHSSIEPVYPSVMDLVTAV